MDRLLCWKKIQGNGMIFENIIKELLKVMFPLEQYTHTQQTRDGGKDFVCITQNAISYWAECKNYSASLALNDVAKTFVMAIAENVKQVMIFSISPFTNVALQEISSFTSKIEYELKIYDGDALDTLMSQYIDKINLSNDFKRDFKMSYIPGKSVVAFSCVTRNNYLDELPNRHFYIGDLVTYNFYFKNNTSNKISITYSFQEEQVPSELLLISMDVPSSHHSFSLEPGSYVQCSYKFRLVNYKKRIRLFDISYNVDNTEEIIKGTYIECDWIAEVPLLGDSREQLQKLKQHFIGNIEVAIMNLYGHSGVGKSRLIKEIRNAYQDQGYTTLFFPIHETRESGKFVIRKILSTITKLPYLPSDDITVNSTQMIYQALYNTGYNIEKNLDEILRFMFEKLEYQKQIVIVIDDLQFGDSLLFTFIKKILSSANNRIIFITGFNQDYLYTGTDAQKLFTQIKAYEEPNQNIELQDFNICIAKQYIYNCLDSELLFENRLEQTIDLFIQHVGTNPLILHQTILYFAQEHILTKKGTCFHIKQIENFNRMIKELNPQIKSLLQRRHSILKRNLSKEAFNYYLVLMKLLSVFHHLSIKQYRQMFFIQTEIWLAELISLGFIKYNDEGDIIFYHQKLESFYFDLRLENNIFKNAIATIQLLSASCFHEKFILKQQAEMICEDDFICALTHLEDVDYNNEYRYMCAIYQESKNFQTEQIYLLNITERYYRIIQNHRGIRFQLENYEKTIYSLMHNVDMYKMYAPLLWRITLTCVNAFIQLHMESNALQILTQFESCIDVFTCTPTEKKDIQASLFNRYGVIYNTYNNMQKAIYYYRKALKYGLETQNRYNIIEAYSDYGALFYDKKGQLWKTLYYWNKLFLYYKKHASSQYEYLIPKCYYHKIQVYLLLAKYSKAEKLLNEYKKKYWTQTHGHYKIKLLFTNIVLEMLKYRKLSDADCDEIKFLLNQVEDECVYNGTVREYYKVFYLKSIFFLYYKKCDEKAYEYLKISYQQIADICQNSEKLIQPNIPILLELQDLILKYENEHNGLEMLFFDDNSLQKFNEHINHIKKNICQQYSLPLKSKNKKIVFPKL